jgi:hypothetical protein
MKKFIAILLVLLVFIPSVSLADDATLGGLGGTVFPVYNTDIVMQKETVDISVKNGKSYVTCNFTFKNTGEKTTLFMGFPSFKDSKRLPGWDANTDETDLQYLNSGDINLYRFKVNIDGSAAQVVKKRGMKNAGNNAGEDYFPVWYTWKVRFKSGETKKITNTFWCYNSLGGEDIEQVWYILKTGAYWKDNINQITVRVKLGDPYYVNYDVADEENYIPDDYAENGTLIWNKTNVEPDKDICVWFHKNTDYDLYNDENSKGKLYLYLVRMQKHFDKAHYRSTIWWGNTILKHYNVQGEAFHYLMGVAYYKRHNYKKALTELSKGGDLGLYYKALTLKNLGKTEDYRECLLQITAMDAREFSGLVFWGQSRLKDIEDQT